MKILVTGGQGFIGYNLIAELLSLGHAVHSLDDLSIGLKEYTHNGCVYHLGDVENIHLMDRDFDIVFHLAAFSRIQPSFDKPKETYRVNTSGTLSVSEFCLKNDIKLIYSGSSSQWHNPYQSPYAITKKLGEDIIKMYGKVYGLDYHIVRFYNVYGQYELMEGEWAAVIGKWRYQVMNGEPITIVGDGSQTRDFTHVDDIVSALILLIDTEETTDDAWELGKGESFTIKEVADMFVDKFGCDIIYVPNQKGNYKHTLRENDEAINKLNWRPTKSLDKYIKKL